MKFDAIIFDFDGVIADSEAFANRELASVLTEMKLPTTYDEALNDYCGLRWADLVTLIESRLGHEIDPQLIGQRFKQLGKAMTVEVGPVAGIGPFLDMTAGIPRAVIASSDLFWLKRTLSRFGFAHHFGEHVYSAANVARGKPHPDIFLHAAQALGIDPARIVAIDDRPSGIASAVAAGIAAIGFTGASHIRGGDAERMRAAGAAKIAMDYDDVADWIDL
jgi:beta-phosphoglucomutase-like phosphatase (HAD superfamily)